MTDQPFSPLVAAILNANAADLAHTTNAVIDNLTEERDEALAELAAVRGTISALLAGDYQPSAEAIQVALWPSMHVISRYRNAEVAR